MFNKKQAQPKKRGRGRPKKLKLGVKAKPPRRPNNGGAGWFDGVQLNGKSRPFHCRPDPKNGAPRPAFTPTIRKAVRGANGYVQYFDFSVPERGIK